MAGVKIINLIWLAIIISISDKLTVSSSEYCIWLDWAKILFLFVLFALVKAIVPRYRYDQLMKLGWKIFLPLSLIWVVLTAAYLLYFDLLPEQVWK